MKKNDELKQQRASKMKEVQSLIDTRKSEKRSFTAEEKTTFNALEDEIENLRSEIEDEEKIEAAEKRNAAAKAAKAPPADFGGGAKEGGEEGEKKKLKQRASITKAIRMATTNQPLTGAEKEMNELALEENKRAGVNTPDNAAVSIPMSFLRADAQTVTEDSGEYGGELVQDYAPRVQMPFQALGLLDRLGVTRLTGLTGGDVPLPVMGEYNFAWLGETEELTFQKSKIEGPKLSANRLAAGVKISNRLLVQSSIAVDNTIRGLLNQGYDRALTTALINGSGINNQPEGILNNSDIPTGSSADADVPTKALVTELVSLVDQANATGTSMKFLGGPGLKYLLGVTKLDAGSGRFLMESMVNLFGFDYVSTTLMPTLSGNFPLIFGDWSKAFVGEWGSLSVLTDPYTSAGANSVRLILNAHADVAIAQPEAFAVNKFFNATDV